MSSVPESAGNNIYLCNGDSVGDHDLMNGFVAGIAGTALHELHMTSTNRRTVRLSANSASFEQDSGCKIPGSISEAEDEILSETDSLEMRISDGNSNYPSQFSLLNISGSTGDDSDATIDVTNCSTIDASLQNTVLAEVEEEEMKAMEEKKEEEIEGEYEGEEKKEKEIEEEDEGEEKKNESEERNEEEKEEEERNKEDEEIESLPSLGTDDTVFSPALNSTFGDFHRDRELSASSSDSFGDFDESPPKLCMESEITHVTDTCFPNDPNIGWAHHSTPKKLLDRNFVWSQARSKVTKPGYTWEKLKLHSYLLGALSVRKPISLNRLKQTTSAAGSYSTSYSVSSPTSPTCTSPVTPDLAPDLPGSPHSEVLCDSDSEIDSLSEIKGWDNTSTASSPQNPCKPCVPSVIQKRLTSHRRVHSSPIPKCVSPAASSDTYETASASGSPHTRRQMTKSGSLESQLSFDETHASRGLSLLQMEDILTMRHEMKSRVSELSATLIKEFQYRGDADHSREVKKAFVSAFLLAEEKKSKGQLSGRQKNLIPIMCRGSCPPTEILVLLTQLLHGIVQDSQHTTDLLKHYVYMLCKAP